MSILDRNPECISSRNHFDLENRHNGHPLDGGSNSKKKAAFFGNPKTLRMVYSKGRFEKVASLTDLYPSIIDLGNFEEHLPHLKDVEVLFSTWSMPVLTAAQVAQLSSLKAVFYAGGSVQYFARPFLERSLLVVSAWHANGTPVAEFTLAQILLASKGYFRNRHEYQSPASVSTAFRGRGNFGETVAILGAGAIGRKVIELLRAFELQVIVFDPFLSERKAAELQVEKTSLETAFERGYIISNHLANVPQTVGMLHGGLFERMRSDATFINTGRGATVDEPSMIGVLQARPDLTALLDVTSPEPPVAGSPLYSLPNVHLTSHIAGSIGDEFIRNADYAIEEFVTWQSGGKLKYSISLPMFQTMA